MPSLTFIGPFLFLALITILCFTALFSISKKISNKFFKEKYKKIGTIGLMVGYLVTQILLFFYLFPLFLVLNFLFLNITGHVIAAWRIIHLSKLSNIWQKVSIILLTLLLLFFEYQLIIWQWDQSMP